MIIGRQSDNRVAKAKKETKPSDIQYNYYILNKMKPNTIWHAHDCYERVRRVCPISRTSQEFLQTRIKVNQYIRNHHGVEEKKEWCYTKQ